MRELLTEILLHLASNVGFNCYLTLGLLQILNAVCYNKNCYLAS